MGEKAARPALSSVGAIYETCERYQHFCPGPKSSAAAAKSPTRAPKQRNTEQGQGQTHTAGDCQLTFEMSDTGLPDKMHKRVARV